MIEHTSRTHIFLQGSQKLHQINRFSYIFGKKFALLPVFLILDSSSVV